MDKAGDDPVPLGEIAPLWSCGQGEFSDNSSPLANLGGQLPVLRRVKNIQPGSKDSNGSAAVPDSFLVGNSVDVPGQSADNGQSRQVQIPRNGLGDGLSVSCVAPWYPQWRLYLSGPAEADRYNTAKWAGHIFFSVRPGSAYSSR